MYYSEYGSLGVGNILCDFITKVITLYKKKKNYEISIQMIF